MGVCVFGFIISNMLFSSACACHGMGQLLRGLFIRVSGRNNRMQMRARVCARDEDAAKLPLHYEHGERNSVKYTSCIVLAMFAREAQADLKSILCATGREEAVSTIQHNRETQLNWIT